MELKLMDLLLLVLQQDQDSQKEKETIEVKDALNVVKRVILLVNAQKEETKVEVEEEDEAEEEEEKKVDQEKIFALVKIAGIEMSTEEKDLLQIQSNIRQEGEEVSAAVEAAQAERNQAPEETK